MITNCIVLPEGIIEQSGDLLMQQDAISFLRYPGGKQRMLNYLIQHLPSRESIQGRFVEPFVGGGSVFFGLNPKRALLTDINPELITLYSGLREHPTEVWESFRAFPPTKKAYYEVRNMEVHTLDLPSRAARILYLNRTCFKGMWRQNASGQFNIGYGGQDRRWVINKETLIAVSSRLQQASTEVSDFEQVIDNCSVEDFLFIDPPYRPGAREMTNDHYVFCKFAYDDHKRLANALKTASRRGIRWAMTTSSHPDILCLFKEYYSVPLPKGVGSKPGILTNNSGETLVCNYVEVEK